MSDKLKHTDPHWDGNLLVVHLDEARAALDLLPPEVEMRVRNTLNNAHHVRRPGFMLAFTIGTDPYDLTTRDLEHLLEAIQGLGYDPGPAPASCGWQTESYTPQDPESTELLQLIYDTGLLALVNAAVLHFHGLALGVNQEDGVVNRLDLHRTSDPEGVWFDEELTRVGRQKLLKAGLILGSQSPEATASERYRLAQEARDAAAGLAGTPEGKRAAVYVELGDLKTIARDKGWDLAFEWIVAHQDAEADG